MVTSKDSRAWGGWDIDQPDHTFTIYVLLRTHAVLIAFQQLKFQLKWLSARPKIFPIF